MPKRPAQDPTGAECENYGKQKKKRRLLDFRQYDEIPNNFVTYDPTTVEVDGTAACGKSTFIDKCLVGELGFKKIGSDEGHEHAKPHKLVECKHLNSIKNSNSLAGAILAMWASVEFVLSKAKLGPSERVVSDRSIFNHEDWQLIWRVLLAHDSKTDMQRYIEKAKTFFEVELSSRRTRENGISIIIIDSDIESVNARLAERNKGSDAVRSKWPHYTTVQNLFYSIKAALSNNAILFDRAKYKSFEKMNEAICEVLSRLILASEKRNKNVPFFKPLGQILVDNMLAVHEKSIHIYCKDCKGKDKSECLTVRDEMRNKGLGGLP